MARPLTGATDLGLFTASLAAGAAQPGRVGCSKAIRTFWDTCLAAAHGVVVLELAGKFRAPRDCREVYEAAMRLLYRGARGKGALP